MNLNSIRTKIRLADVRFYLVAILFIIFDIEITFLFPWAITLGSITGFGFWTMALFLILLTIGFVYEWKKGAFNGSNPYKNRKLLL